MTAEYKLEVSKTSKAYDMSGVAILGGVAITMARGVGVEAASVCSWGRVTGGGSARGGACRIGALRQCGYGQRDARRRNGGNQCELGLVDHDLSPVFRSKKKVRRHTVADQEMCSMQVIID